LAVQKTKNISTRKTLKKIKLKAFLWFWFLSNAEVAIHHCSATKPQKFAQVYFLQQFSLWEDTTLNWGPLKTSQAPSLTFIRSLPFNHMR